MSEIVKDIANYPMSEDYELLWDLAQKQGIVCEVDYNFYCGEEPPVRDIARTIFRRGSVAVSVRGACYFEEDSKERFFECCKKYHVKFIVPSSVPFPTVEVIHTPEHDGATGFVRDLTIQEAIELLPKMINFILMARDMNLISGISADNILTLPCGDRVKVKG